MKKNISNHKDLIVWQKSIDLVADIYQLTKSFPEDELYGLTSQMRRAVISIPSNIAEGCARSSTKEFLRFIQISKGSLAEIETQAIIANKLEYITTKILEEKIHKIVEIRKITGGLERKLKERIHNKEFVIA